LGPKTNRKFTRWTLRSEEGEESQERVPPSAGSGICKWFNVHMGFGFLSMIAKGSVALLSPLDVFVHQRKLHMEGFCSLKEGEAVEFIFKESSNGLESIQVTGPRGIFCISRERRPKGKSLQKRRSKGDCCYNCSRLHHQAKECNISHMVTNCPARAQQSPSSQGKPAYSQEEEDIHSLPEVQQN
uniref:CSD domain-containing protein n=1 Tax=Malurus cyaneus samueli TaxID=2593467 RepID=A0A8C5X0T1_9PASS